MTTNYDPIAEQYQLAKQQPWRAHIEAFTLLGLVGDLAGRDVVDLACGEGFFSRQLRARGAQRVVGVDLSEKMIELAQVQESARPQGIEYLVGDCRDLQLAAPCDLAVAAYLLNYARDRAELAAMCQSAARALKPGGRFVTVNCNPALDFGRAPSYRKYGFETTVRGDFVEGAPIVWKFFLEETRGTRTFEIENYHLDVAIHEQAFAAAGFRQVRWHSPRLSPAGASALGQEFWDSFLAHSPITFIECLK